MVVRETPAGWYLVTQPEHAQLAGKLARRWSVEALPGCTEPEFLEAVARHDIGWREFDARPRLTPDGAPLSFLNWPLEEAVQAWTRSIAEAAGLGRLAGYVVTQHFAALARMALGRPLPRWERQAAEKFLAESDSLPRHPEWDSLVPLLQVCDLLSLHLITAGAMNTALLGRLGIAADFHPADEVLLLKPFPFRAQLALHCRAAFLRRGSHQPQPIDDLEFIIA